MSCVKLVKRNNKSVVLKCNIIKRIYRKICTYSTGEIFVRAMFCFEQNHSTFEIAKMVSVISSQIQFYLKI